MSNDKITDIKNFENDALKNFDLAYANLIKEMRVSHLRMQKIIEQELMQSDKR